MFSKLIRTLALAALLPASSLAATVVVWNGDPAGVGFNDPTPAVPVGGNPGTTVGQQALNVFQRAADIWGGRLQSKQTINIIAFFTPLSCTATSGVLGAAGANWFFRDVEPANGAKGMVPGTCHHAALAEKLTYVDLTTQADPSDFFEIFSLFNSELGKPGCLTGRGWYYGLDNNEPAVNIDLLSVVLHEFGHGLGFSLGTTSSSSGARPQGFPSVWERYMYDVTARKTWLEMGSNSERAASARNDGNLVWIGQKARNVLPSVLDREVQLTTIRPSGIPTVTTWPATFGAPALQAPGRVFGSNLLAPNDGGGASPRDGCEAFPNPNALAGRVLLVERGNCAFLVKAANAQAAGAAGLLISNDRPGIFSPSGTDAAITIPVYGISQAAGAQLRAAAGAGSVYVELSADPNVRAGTTAGFPRLYAPLTFAQGSSVSHWDISASPSLLMEPFNTANITSSVKNPEDLSRALLVDIGW